MNKNNGKDKDNFIDRWREKENSTVEVMGPFNSRRGTARIKPHKDIIKQKTHRLTASHRPTTMVQLYPQPIIPEKKCGDTIPLSCLMGARVFQ